MALHLICENFGLIANLCQVVDLLPRERYDNVMNAVQYFEKILQCIDHDECIKVNRTVKDNNQKKS